MYTVIFTAGVEVAEGNTVLAGEQLRRTNVELKEWYSKLDTAVFDWR